jgi:hypothetical protein
MPIGLTTLALLFASTSFAQRADDCVLPGSPIVPDGNVATEDELLASQAAVKAFQASLGDYRGCLENQRLKHDPETDEGKAAILSIIETYNKSGDAEEQVGAQFNQAVRDYKARN